MAGVLQFADEEQLAWIEQADQIRDLRAAPTWAALVATFERAGVPDVDELAAEVATLGEAARAVRAEREVLQAQVRAAASGVDARREAIDGWIGQAHAALDYLRARRDPAYTGIARKLFRPEADAPTARQGQRYLEQLLLVLERVVDPATLRLPEGFVAEGRRLRDELVAERTQRHIHAFGREGLTARLHALMADLVIALDQLSAARDYVTAITGTTPVGLGMAYVRAAGGRSGPAPSAAPVDDGPLPPLEPVADAPDVTLG